MIQIYPVPAFQDNYLWLLVDHESAQAAVVDPGDAGPVEAFLQAHQLSLGAILITHHHADHIGGVDQLRRSYPEAVVYGPDSSRIPQVTQAVSQDSVLTVLGREFQVLEVPGHTLEHIAYFSKPDAGSAPLLFCGDTLFAGGCGRMFEGTPVMMQASLQKLADLPPDTAVYCAHEYTLSNLRFASAVEPKNADLAQRIRQDSQTRNQGKPTVPSTIGLELQTNPFLRCEQSQVIAAANQTESLSEHSPAAVFGVLRRWKDHF